MDDDFNTPGALAVLFDLTTEVNTLLNSGATLSAGHWRRLMGRISWEAGAGDCAGSGQPEPNGDLLDGLVKLLIEMRAEARPANDYNACG